MHPPPVVCCSLYVEAEGTPIALRDDYRLKWVQKEGCLINRSVFFCVEIYFSLLHVKRNTLRLREIPVQIGIVTFLFDSFETQNPLVLEA